MVVQRQTISRLDGIGTNATTIDFSVPEHPPFLLVDSEISNNYKIYKNNRFQEILCSLAFTEVTKCILCRAVEK